MENKDTELAVYLSKEEIGTLVNAYQLLRQGTFKEVSGEVAVTIANTLVDFRDLVQSIVDLQKTEVDGEIE